jgi:hypothetical protein
MKPTLAERMENNIIPVTETGCFLWMAKVNNKGYGRISVHNHSAYAHRVSYELFRGPILEGMQVLHKCDTPRCVNPEHLFLGTRKDNMQDMIRKGRQRKPTQQTHCKRGHPYVPENIRMYRGKRNCIACQRENVKNEAYRKQMAEYRKNAEYEA